MNQQNEYPLAEQAGAEPRQRDAGLFEGVVGIGRSDAADGALTHRPGAPSLPPRRDVGRFMRATPMPAGHWIVSSRTGAMLGTIEWYPRWRQYVLVPSIASVFSWDCLRDLSAFVRELSEARAPVGPANRSSQP